ncbi:MAG TPA: biotin carboxylase N-terminal domain-containing protein [Vicinamibacterales bacterium]|nr:biotin carboxylase N-terminal domain-containing protein [Vicinamibacterales bacterium]
MFRRVLVANRGEIALRVMRACRELGVETVAVYSDEDRSAPHAAAADRAVPIGSSSSYLDQAALLRAALDEGADAVHPGYGFLAENAGFAAACEQAGLAFIGPPPRAIAEMGSKIASRAHAAAAGVMVVPGEAPGQEPSAIAAAAARLGYPVLVKASAGGGGKGMRIVGDSSELARAVASARHEAGAAFGDATLYLERLLHRPRHVEVQVFGDTYGQVVHLFERDCSIQRRHQKVVEESPSPGLPGALRERMGQAAVRLATHIGYRGAGTVEFLLEGSGAAEPPFYFLEMNTRLQVEHPVTEAVVGVDLVQAQIAVAAGEPLPWSQERLTQRGHAIECRIYAEDPAAGFLPQAGRLAVYREPVSPGIRIDSGVTEGTEIGVSYDPLLAKLVACAETREAARRRAVAALRQYAILGIRTNIPFLVRVLEHPRFRDATIDTGFLDEHDELATDAQEPGALAAALAAAAVHEPERRPPEPGVAVAATADPWDLLSRWGRAWP